MSNFFVINFIGKVILLKIMGCINSEEGLYSNSHNGLKRKHLHPFCKILVVIKASEVALVVKNLPPSAGRYKESRVQSLGRKGPLEEGMPTHSSILA